MCSAILAPEIRAPTYQWLGTIRPKGRALITRKKVIPQVPILAGSQPPNRVASLLRHQTLRCILAAQNVQDAFRRVPGLVFPAGQWPSARRELNAALGATGLGRREQVANRRQNIRVIVREIPTAPGRPSDPHPWPAPPPRGQFRTSATSKSQRNFKISICLTGLGRGDSMRRAEPQPDPRGCLRRCSIGVSLDSSTVRSRSIGVGQSASHRHGKPNLNGIWQANNTANWDLEHAARAGEVVELGAVGATPAGLRASRMAPSPIFPQPKRSAGRTSPTA